jgi:hypothetical protein
MNARIREPASAIEMFFGWLLYLFTMVTVSTVVHRFVVKYVFLTMLCLVRFVGLW